MEQPSRGAQARPATLVGARVLLVEDDVIVAMDMTALLEAAGAVVVGPFARLEAAMAEVKEALPDAALLDIEIVGGRVFPLADVLRDAGVPLVFHSGAADRSAVDRRYPAALLCAKPSTSEAVLGALDEVLSRRRSAPELTARR